MKGEGEKETERERVKLNRDVGSKIRPKSAGESEGCVISIYDKTVKWLDLRLSTCMRKLKVCK